MRGTLVRERPQNQGLAAASVCEQWRDVEALAVLLSNSTALLQHVEH